MPRTIHIKHIMCYKQPGPRAGWSRTTASRANLSIWLRLPLREGDEVLVTISVPARDLKSCAEPRELGRT
jgi:hypothetical protein